MGYVPKLLTFDQAAKELNVPATALRTVADRYGKTIQIGRSLRVDEADLKELIQLCRAKPKVPIKSGETEPPKDESPSGKSETAPSGNLPAQRIAKLLKKSSPNT